LLLLRFGKRKRHKAGNFYRGFRGGISACLQKKITAKPRQSALNYIPEKRHKSVLLLKSWLKRYRDPDKEISLEQAREIKKSYKAGDEIIDEVTPKSFGRIAAQTAKQVMLQKLREAERDCCNGGIYEKENEIFTGIIRRIEG
jgi:N utilization substance protein A